MYWDTVTFHFFSIYFRGGQHFFFSDEYCLLLFGEESFPKEVFSSKKESNPVETFVLSLGVGPYGERGQKQNMEEFLPLNMYPFTIKGNYSYVEILATIVTLFCIVTSTLVTSKSK